MFDPFAYVRERLTEAIVGSVDDANEQLHQRAIAATPHLVVDADTRRIAAEDQEPQGKRRGSRR